MTTKQIRNKRVTAIPATKIPGHTTVQGTRPVSYTHLTLPTIYSV